VRGQKRQDASEAEENWKGESATALVHGAPGNVGKKFVVEAILAEDSNAAGVSIPSGRIKVPAERYITRLSG
jgi:hypothetical protein